MSGSHHQSRILTLLRAEPENDSYHYECPECGNFVAEWCDCPECGWYDGEAWEAAVKRRKAGVQLAMANPLELEEWI